MTDVIVLPVDTKITVIPTSSTAAVVVTNSVISTGGSTDLVNYYTKTQTDALLSAKANSPIIVNDISDFDGTVMAGGTF